MLLLEHSLGVLLPRFETHYFIVCPRMSRVWMQKLSLSLELPPFSLLPFKTLEGWRFPGRHFCVCMYVHTQGCIMQTPAHRQTILTLLQDPQVLLEEKRAEPC
jgi:hypothetical protein